MSEVISIELPDDLAGRARAIAEHTHRPVEDILVEWLNKAVNDTTVASLPDDEVLALCEMQLDELKQAELSELLDLNREGHLHQPERGRLDELMQVYRHGLLRKAQALKVAVERGLRQPL